MQRSLAANYLGILLILLTVFVGGAGYFTYHNLNEVVNGLEVDSRPNTNLLLYKEILVSLQEMDNLTETFQISGEERFKERYEETADNVLALLDSINLLNMQDFEMILLNDSLQTLLLDSKAILDELMLYTDQSQLEELTGLNKITQKIPEVRKAATVAPEPGLDEPKPVVVEEKRSILKRIFGKKTNEPSTELAESEPLTTAPETRYNSDSLLDVQRAQIQAEINRQIARIKTNARNLSTERKNQQMKLELAHLDIQSQIFDLVGFLESRENVKIQIASLRAKELAFKTNEQIRYFFILATLLLISSLIIMIVYVRRNRAYQRLLRESKTAVETLAKAKERFFANMSHELRTPMNAISGFTKILMKSDLNPTQQEHIQIIHKSSDHLLRLLNDILDFSKLQAEKLRLETTPFAIAEVCNDSIKLMSEAAQKKGLILKTEFRDLPPMVLGDPNRLRQILLNLLSNSIKYTEQGQVTLRAVSRKHDESCAVEIQVSDTGIGIPKDQQYKLFREFEQADQSSFSKGTGLGLAITKRLIQLHGGSIRLESTENVGTTVSFEIMYPPATGEFETEESVTMIETPADLKVLIADDEPFNIKLLSTMLENRGIDFVEAEDGESALELAMVSAFDVILLDLKMPGIDGWEVAERIRNQNGPNKNTPIIALTATLAKLDHEKAQRAGFDYIMRKPFDEDQLFSLIAAKTKKQASQSFSETDISGLLKMGNREFVTEMIDTFIASSKNGILELKDDLNQKKYEQVALVAHRIVAPARHFKANRLVTLLKTLEKRAGKSDQTLNAGDISEIEAELELVTNSLIANLQKQAS